MATEFEVIIAQDGVDADYARQVADALFAEVDRMEEELSRFRAGSDEAPQSIRKLTLFPVT